MKKKTTSKLLNSCSSQSKVLLLCLILMLLFASSIYAQDPAQYGTPYTGVSDPRDANIYQVHIRPHSAAGNLAAVTADLDRIKALGINVLYLMPIYPYGTDSRSSNSPYCIKDFKAVGSEYGSLTDLRNLSDAAHSRGMSVILDWVANQTSWDHPWITQHPDYYVQSNGVIQQLSTYPDVAALNFNSTAMKTAMIDAMRYWVFAANIDGYRCDFADSAPATFWTQAISNLRGITSHKLILFAEGTFAQNFTSGFDMNFGFKWYGDALKSVHSWTSVAQLQTVTNTEYTSANASQQIARYTANHDSETTETAMNVFGGHDGVIANFLVSAYMRGVPFLTSGQEADFNQIIPWPYTSVKINWSNTTAKTDFTKILNFRNSSVAIRRGTMTNYSNTNVCAFTKTSGSEKVIVITNLRGSSSTFVVPAAMAGSFKEVYTGATINLTSGATMTLNPYQYLVVTNLYYYTIQNRWKGTYLYDAGANVGYGATVANNNYRWEKVMVDGRYMQFKNLGTGEFMHIENQTGSVQCGAITAGWSSAQWTPEYIDGTWIRIRNKWQPASIVNVEGQTGAAQYSGAQDSFYSAQWQLNAVAAGTATSRLSNAKSFSNEEGETTLITIYPNPATNNQFNIILPELEANDIATVTVTDLNGKIVFVKQISVSTKIDHNLATGLYLVNVNTNHLDVTKKVIIK
ncbi:alpha-amylase family glycosyl hydrolase [Flavobacterium sp. AED]|uniref:alpha-amylase family glycosyl hydrolase n=1 Tax=Flavobacterium sp. AED TaxID=1423323 RepID=UPI0009DEB5E1|nr:alpha-amylase family glycosyl hydrolase [Flavobacterium sp. AED]